MSGFGYGPFGHTPFGKFAYGRYFLYDALPVLYRERDEENDYTLRKFADGVANTFDYLHDKAENLVYLTDAFEIEDNSPSYTFRLGQISIPVSAPDMIGYGASVDSLGKVTTVSGRFTSADIGKEFVLLNSTLPSNFTPVTISEVVSLKEIYTDPKLSTETGPLKWLIRKPLTVDPIETTIAVELGDVSLVRPGYRLSTGDSVFNIKKRYSFNSDLRNTQSLIVRQGTDAEIILISGQYVLVSPTANFSFRDAGKTVLVPEVGGPLGSGRWTAITPVDPALLTGDYSGWSGMLILDAETLTTTPTQAAQSLYWGIMPTGYLVLEGNVSPTGVAEQQGYDLNSTSLTPPRVSAASAKFTASDVGKIITIVDYFTDLGLDTRTITSVLSATEVQLSGANFSSSFTSRGYTVRTATSVLGGEAVSIYPKGLLSDLAQNFAAPVSEKENSTRKREWVDAIPRWLTRKATQNTYKDICALSGYGVDVDQLYRVDLNNIVGALVPSASYVKLYNTNSGKSGADASLTYSGGTVRISSPTASFAVSDVGSNIEITNAADADNNKIYTIDSIVSSTEVSCIPSDYNTDMTLPDGNNGSIDWDMLKLYTKNAPLLPNYDEINVDLMQEWVGTSSFHVDKWCYELDFSTKVQFVLNTPVSTEDNTWDIELLPVTRLQPSGPSIGSFSVGQTVTGGISLATGVIVGIDGATLYLYPTTGTFLPPEVVTSGTGSMPLSTVTVSNPDVIVKPDNFTVTIGSTSYRLEDYDSATNKITVFSLVTPATGFAEIEYVCPIQDICGVCSSPVVLITITSTNSPEISQSELEIRLQQVTPANTTVVVQ